MTDNVPLDTAARIAEFEPWAEEVHSFCLPLCAPEDTKEAQAADYAIQALDVARALLSELATARQALELAARAFAQYAEETNEPTEEAIAGFMEGFIQDAQLRKMVRRDRRRPLRRDP